MISFLDLVILILAAARIVRLGRWDKITLPIREFLVTEPGPKTRLNRLRRALRTGESSWLGYLIHCGWCIGVYAAFATAALFFAIGGNPIAQTVLVALAVAEVAPRVVDWEPRNNGGR